MIDKNIESFKRRFEKYVIKNENGCWEWRGGKVTRGYGAFRCNITKRQIGAHRASWRIHFGEIPKGMFVCHKCDNPPCTNPEHLFLGTSKDNLQDMIKKERNKHHTKEMKEKRASILRKKQIRKEKRERRKELEHNFRLYIKNNGIEEWLKEYQECCSQYYRRFSG